MGIWGYDNRGRFYKRETGTKRYPDTGDVMYDKKQVGKEITGHHSYGIDVGKPKKKMSKTYKRHPVKRYGKTKFYRGNYKRRLR